jgi:hypothetical protein
MGRKNPRRNIPQRWLAATTTILSGLPLAAAYAAQVFLSWQLPAWLFVTLLAVGVAATVGSVLVQASQTRRQQNSLEAIEKMGNTFAAALTSYLGPLADIKSRLVNAEDDAAVRQSKAELIRATIGSANSDLFPANTRCCFFTLADDDLRGRSLKPVARSGRTDRFECVLNEYSGVVGPYIFNKIIDPQASELRGELTRDEFHEWNETLGFKSGIACAVFAGANTFGMLTWDAPEANALDQTHEKIAQLLAQDLGTMLAVKPAINPYP